MGLFDKFRKKVQHAASEVDTESLSAEEGTDEAKEALDQHQEYESNPPSSNEEEWEELDENEELELPPESSDDWDDWDEEEEYALPTKLTRKEKKVLAEQALFLSRQSYEVPGITVDLEMYDKLRSFGQTRGQARHWVFTRNDMECHNCNSLIIHTRPGGRRLDYCPTCQPEC